MPLQLLFTRADLVVLYHSSAVHGLAEEVLGLAWFQFDPGKRMADWMSTSPLSDLDQKSSDAWQRPLPMMAAKPKEDPFRPEW